MKKSLKAKILGYVAASAYALGQAGVFGPKYSPFLLYIGPILAAFGIHAAANTDGRQ